MDLLTTLAKTEAIIDSYRRFKNPSPNHLLIREETSQPICCPPLDGFVKINVDGATNLEKQATGLGVVVRDCRNFFVAAVVKKVHFFGDVQQAEEKAIAWGCQVAKEIGQSSVLVNTNSQGIAELVNKR